MTPTRHRPWVNISKVLALVILAASLLGDSAAANEIRMPESFSRSSRATLHPASGVPKKVIGINAFPMALQGGRVALTKDNADGVFRSFLRDNREFFRVNPDELTLKSAARSRRKWFIKYQQHYRGIPVEGATVGMSASENGMVRSYGSSFYPGITVPTEGTITLDQAVGKARATYKDGKGNDLAVKESGKIIFPDRTRDGVRFHLAWKFLLAGTRPDVDVDKYFIVDATDGAILKQYPRVFPGARVFGRVTGDVFPVNPLSPPMTTVPLMYEDVLVGSWGTATTDANGDYGLSVPDGTTATVAFRLSGPYAEVGDYDTGNVYQRTAACADSGPCNHRWADADPDNSNVFRHINLLHDWYRDRLGYDWVNAWQNTNRFRALVNRPNYGDAYAGDPMVFGNNNVARSSDVVYHECTHNVLYALFGGSWIGFSDGLTTEGYAFDEGFADYFASAATEDPRFGEGYGYPRTLANALTYQGKDGYNSDGHIGGTIIAGAAWDLRTTFRARMDPLAGGRLADNLVFEALQEMAVLPRQYFFSDPQESNFLTSLYLADDDNGNLLDGVPHFRYIQDAFARHDLLRAVLLSSDSYDVSTNSVGTLTGGDFYFLQGAFRSDKAGQRGVRDLGDIGGASLDSVPIPQDGFTQQGVAAVVGHTYVALAQQGEEGCHIVFRVNSVNADATAISYRYRAPLPVPGHPSNLILSSVP